MRAIPSVHHGSDSGGRSLQLGFLTTSHSCGKDMDWAGVWTSRWWTSSRKPLPPESYTVFQNSSTHWGWQWVGSNTCILRYLVYKSKQAWRYWSCLLWPREPSLSWVSPLLSGPFPNRCRTPILKLLLKLMADRAAGVSIQREVAKPCGPANPSSLTLCAKSLWRELFSVITFSIICERSLKKIENSVCINSQCGQTQWSISNLKSDGYL